MKTSLVLSQWSAVSPFGMDQSDFVQGLHSRSSALTSVNQDAWSTPYSMAGIVPHFDVREEFGPKGTRALDRATGLAMKSVGQLLDQLAGDIGRDSDIGLVLGTTAGSVQSAMDFVKDSFVQARPFQVDPSRFPNAVMNRAAGQCAIWHGLRGPNATIAGGRAAGLLALKYGARLHRRARAQTVLCGSVEEYSEQRAWMAWRTDDEHRPLGEGCAIFALETAQAAQQCGRSPLAELVSVCLGVWSADDPPESVLAHQLTRALAEIGDQTQSVRAVITGGGPTGALAAAESIAVRRAFGDSPQIIVEDLLGDTGAASAGFQLAAALSTPGPTDRPHIVVTSVDRDGVVGCAVVRLVT